MSTTSKLLAGAIVVLLVVAAGYVVLQGTGTEEETFCQPALPIRAIGERTVAVETKATPGGTCPVPRVNEGMDTLGTDCKVRDEHGAVIETVPTLPDGTC